jgi:hypothetical protein
MDERKSSKPNVTLHASWRGFLHFMWRKAFLLCTYVFKALF